MDRRRFSLVAVASSELTAVACPAPGAWTAGGSYESSPPTSTEQFLGLPGNSLPFVATSAR